MIRQVQYSLVDLCYLYLFLTSQQTYYVVQDTQRNLDGDFARFISSQTSSRSSTPDYLSFGSSDTDSGGEDISKSHFPRVEAKSYAVSRFNRNRTMSTLVDLAAPALTSEFSLNRTLVTSSTPEPEPEDAFYDSDDIDSKISHQVFLSY